jgi:hypothetical protein
MYTLTTKSFKLNSENTTTFVSYLEIILAFKLFMRLKQWERGTYADYSARRGNSCYNSSKKKYQYA